MRRRNLLAVGAVVVVGAGLLAARLWWPDAAATPYRDSAVDDAAEKVDRVQTRFTYDHLYRADDYAHTAAQQPDVTVLSVTGETHWQTGVTLVLRVTGHGQAVARDGSVVEGDEQICFRLRLGPERDRRDDDIACPAGDPLPVSRDPSLGGVDDRLKRALASAGPDESAVRSAVAGLGLDPAVGQDVAARQGMVGVALRASQYDCLLGRVTPKGAEIWRPSHTQLAPGELPCSAETALSSLFGKYPH
ncbi:hypothetical protein [Micromonospora eburnea]|uniref:hypothetical protein n=1 Tax=Micromonospora eburnea TaxID=227316 RepID=UPI00114D0BE1|nr:hypothetical protein [Micromonospora eburnea]